MTLEEAKIIAYKFLYTQNDSSEEDINRPLIVDDATEEYEYGWLFHYNGKKFIETGDTASCYLGGIPIFVDKNDGSLKGFNPLFGPLEEQINNFYLNKYKDNMEDE